MDADPQPMPNDADARTISASGVEAGTPVFAPDAPTAEVPTAVAPTADAGLAPAPEEPSADVVDPAIADVVPSGIDPSAGEASSSDAVDAAGEASSSAAVDAAAEAVTIPNGGAHPAEALPAADQAPAIDPAPTAPPAPTLEPAPAVAEAFRAFYHHLGPTLCGAPVSPLVEEAGMPTQYFQHVALESPLPGHVRLKSIGEAAWEARRLRSARPPTATAPVIDDLTGQLVRHPGRAYATRPLTHVRYLVLHATGAPAHVGPHAIARAHVDDNGWPGIGYHFVVGAEGAVYRTQDLTVVSHHVAQFNPVAVGIALAGDLAHADPPSAQLAAAADLVAQLCWDLGLPATAVRGHREMVPTPCPGERFLDGWKPRLMRAVADRLEAQAARAAAEGLGAGTPDASVGAAAAQGVAPGA